MKNGASMGDPVKRFSFAHRNLNGVTKSSVIATQKMKNLLFSASKLVIIDTICRIILTNIASDIALSKSDITFAVMYKTASIIFPLYRKFRTA